MVTRCEEVVVQIVVREYDDEGHPVSEQVSQPIKVFRNAVTKDFWGHVDQTVAALAEKQAAAGGPTKVVQSKKNRR